METVKDKIDENEISKLIEIVERHRQKAYRKVNEELVSMYFELGKYLSEKIKEMEWGTKKIENVAKELLVRFPNSSGFNRAGLYRMVQFYETYAGNEIVAPLVRQISWTNNMVIFSHKSSIEEKEFYIRLCIKNNYSKRELQRQINSHYFERYILSGTMSESKMPAVGEDDYPNTRILDTYSLEFLDLPNNYKEKDLQSAIVDNLTDFILEIGSDFTLVGKEYKITVGNSDYFIDLLFYNRSRSCLVAFELKIGKFEPEYISKMDFYLEALDRNVKKEHENPSVGIILCSDRDDVVVEYASARTTSEMAVSTYKTELIDRGLLQNKLIQFRKMLGK